MKPKDVAQSLNISQSTLRNYSKQCEEAGYLFKRNEQNHRVYEQSDLNLLNDFVKLRKGNSKLSNAEILKILGYSPITSQTIDTDSYTKNLAQDNNIQQEVESLKSQIGKLNNQVDELNVLVTSVVNMLIKNDSSIKTNQVLSATIQLDEKIDALNLLIMQLVDQDKKSTIKSVFNRIKSR